MPIFAILLVSSLSAQIEIYDIATPKQLYLFTKKFQLTQTLADKILETDKIPTHIVVTKKGQNSLEAYILNADNRNKKLLVLTQNGISKIKLATINAKFIDRYAVVSLDVKSKQLNETDTKFAKQLAESIFKYTGKKPFAISALKQEKLFDNIVFQQKTVALLGEADGFFMFAFEYNGKLYDKNGILLDNAGAVTPVAFDRVSDFYSNGRLHPILKYFRAHQGIDLAAKYGTSVHSVLDGKVVDVGYSPNIGNYVKITHDNKIETIYGHLSKVRADLKPGSSVSKNEVIGLVGSTGLATGPHLHFGVKKDGEYINPAALYDIRRERLRDINFFTFAQEARRLLLEPGTNTKTARNGY